MFIRSYASPPAERNAACLNCHNKDSQRALWATSQHAGAELACNSCHKIHANRDKVLNKATQTEVCYSCHKEQRAQLNKVSHHPIPEGKMSCADCHNVHGSAGPKLVKRDSTNATCYTCHAEKRGPFVHQHEPVVEDCANCHNPHGSNVAAMLKARPPLLCQQCHTPHVAGGVGALAGQSGVSSPAAGLTQPLINATSSGKNVVNLWQGRSCLNCHTQIHGSNNPSTGNPTPQLMLR
jgi:DmsE family decaheme c-type cytochrome